MLLARLRAAALVLAPLLLAGCLDYTETLTLEKDGGGTLAFDFTVDMSYMADVSRAIGDEPTPEDTRGPTREEVAAGLEADGITVEELIVDEQTKDKKTRVRARIRFKDLAALGRLEGFGNDRKLEFFDEGGGKVRVVYSFDTSDLVPIEEVAPDEAGGAEEDPVEKKILEISKRARENLRFRAKVVMPGAVEKSNGKPDPQDPNAARWRVDRESEPEKHERLGRGKIVMMLMVERASLPFVQDKDIKQPPARREGDDKPAGPKPEEPRRPGPPSGLGD